MTDSELHAKTISAVDVEAAIGADMAPTALHRMLGIEGAAWCPDLATGRWIVARYERVREILLAPDSYSCGPQADFLIQSLPDDAKAEFEATRYWPLYADGEMHKLMRAAMRSTFAEARLDATRKSVEGTTAQMIHHMQDIDAPDLVRDLAVQVPTRTICQIMGLPVDDAPYLKQLSANLIKINELLRTENETDAVVSSWRQLWQYFDLRLASATENENAWLFAIRSAVFELITPSADAQAAAVATCISLLLGGHETTTNLVANCAIRMFASDKLRTTIAQGDRATVSAFVNEVMRFDPPAVTTARIASEGARCGQHAFRAGDRVLLLLCAANRDPAAFDRPDEFDIARKSNRHLGFGFGLHACFGASVARLQAEQISIAIARSNLHLDSSRTSQRRESQVLRGLSSIPVTTKSFEELIGA